MNSNDNDMFRNNIVLKFDIILKDLSLSRKFEQSIYNYIIEKSMVNNIIRSWGYCTCNFKRSATKILDKNPYLHFWHTDSN